MSMSLNDNANVVLNSWSGFRVEFDVGSGTEIRRDFTTQPGRE